ncbi:MAG: SUMF1/EgtB/PvdO family nonheme iron enzyme [Geminicoccaceae bacterium]
MAPKPDAFLSYTRFDDRRGRISAFRAWLSDAVEEVSGHAFDIFQDVDDENGIALGKTWRKELGRMLDQTRFFIPILTPKFFRSPICRDELEKFLGLEANSGRDDLILPIYWIDCPVLEEASLLAKDRLAKAIDARQRWDWRDLRFEAWETPSAQRAFVGLARQIERARKNLRVVADNGSQLAKGGGRGATAATLMRPRRDAQGPTIVATSSGASSLRAGTVFHDVDAPWCPEMVVIPPGTFSMGSPGDEAERDDGEGPEHQVTFEKPFALGRFPVTSGEFAAFAKESGHGGKGAYLLKDDIWKFDKKVDWRSPGFEQADRHPVVCVSHEDALAYLAWLSEKTEKLYHLPSEAAWEYACRAGTTTPFWTGKTIGSHQANYDGTIAYRGGKKGVWRKGTTRVDNFSANPFGLHDMHGNVWEWCADRWRQTYEGAPIDGTGWFAGRSSKRVMRGGSWLNAPHLLRSAGRAAIVAGFRYYNLGFRCARF